MTQRFVLSALAVLAVFFAIAAPASARTRAIDHGGTYWGNVIVERDQIVKGDVNVIFGDATIEGTVDGNVNAFGGSIDELDGAVITGTQNQFGGDYAQSVAPWMGATGTSLMVENARIFARLMYSVVIVLVFLIFPVRVRVALDRLEKHPGLSTAVGVLALVAVVPILVLLIVSVVGWPLIPLEFVAIIAGGFIGQAALGLLIGRRLYELVRPATTPSPLAALVIGLIVLCAAEIVPGIGGLITALVWMLGLGAAVLAFVRESTFMGGAGAAGARPPISGPPMNVA